MSSASLPPIFRNGGSRSNGCSCTSASTSLTPIATETSEALFAALEGTALAQALRSSRWGYAAVNTAHVFAISLLTGAVVPLNLRLLGLWRGVARESVARVLALVAASGLAFALLTGPLLFSVRAREYSGVEFLQLQPTFIAVGVLATLAICRAHGFLLNDVPRNRVVGHAILSTVCWRGALVCGRLIAFTGD